MGTTKKLLSGDVSGFGEDILGAGKQLDPTQIGQAKKAEVGETQAVAGQAKGLGEALASQRQKLESADRSIQPVTAERIDRAGVQNVQGAQLTAPTIQRTQIAQAPQAEFRQQQAGLAQALAQRAAGTGGPSIAEMQLRQASDRALAQQAAMQAGATGPGAALARRQIAQQGAAGAQQLAGQSALLRAQEQQAAEQQLAGLASQARAQDIGLATGQAGLSQQESLAQAQLQQQAQLAQADQALKAQLANQGVDLDVLKTNAAVGNQAALANLQSQLQQLGMSDAQIRAYLNAELGTLRTQAQIQQSILNAELARNQANAAARAGVTGGLLEGLSSGMGMSGSSGGGSGGGDLMSMAGSVAEMFSDENVKKDIVALDDDEEDEVKVEQITVKKPTIDLSASAEGPEKAGKNIGAGIGTAIKQAIMAAAGSDKDMKEDVTAYSDKDSKTKLDELFDNMRAYEYEYKDEKFGEPGKHVSPMAQDIEKSEIGKRAIMETEEGKVVNYGKLLPAMLAEQIQSRKKIMKLEDALMARKDKGNK